MSPNRLSAKSKGEASLYRRARKGQINYTDHQEATGLVTSKSHYKNK